MRWTRLLSSPVWLVSMAWLGVTPLSAGAEEGKAASCRTRSEFRIVAGDMDKEVVASLKPHLEAGREKVEKWFGRPFKQSFDVEVFASRATFDEYFRKRWKIPKTEAWMVASGVADRLLILSPRVWKTEALEHDPANVEHVKLLLAHELVHVFHGQHCPRPDFDGMDEMGWFVEGLAVYVSGQLEGAHRKAAADAIKAEKAPNRLAKAWSGRYRYGVSGSIVEYVDARHGRAMIEKLLQAVSNAEALKLLDVSEATLLQEWKAHAGASK